MAQGSPTPESGWLEEAAAWYYDTSSDGFAIAKDGVLISVNPAWCAINRTTYERAIGMHVIKVVHPEDRPAFIQAAARLDTHGEALLEHRLRTADGATVWVRASVKRGGGGADLIVVQDVTAERNQREEAETKARVGELLRSAAGVFPWTFFPDERHYVFDSDFDIRCADDAEGTRIVTTAEMTAAVHPDDREAFAAAFYPCLKTGEAGQFWYRHLRADGTWAQFRAEWRGLRHCESGKWDTQGLTQDMTELADARDAALLGEKAAKEAVEIKSQFLANMSHEIRTPLNGVLGVLHLLKGETLSDEGRQLLDEAVKCGSMLTELMNDVLDFSMIQSGRLELNSEAVDVAALIQDVSAILRPQVETKGLVFSIEIDSGAGWMLTDPLRMRQVLFNLIGNAVKFTHQGRVSIRAKTQDVGENRKLRLEIADTGIGMSDETLAGLFVGFHQADGSATRRFGGTGLGLAIVRTLTELMGGQVGVHSVIGAGSTFWIELPAIEIAAPEGGEDGGWLDGVRILVVEDNPTNRLIATKMLENLGASVETAENGALGVEAMRARHFDLVFMDIQMPVMDGITATTAIRALPAPANQAPIIAVTANAMAHQQAEYVRVGMNGFIAKPLSPSAIIAEIAKLAA